MLGGIDYRALTTAIRRAFSAAGGGSSLVAFTPSGTAPTYGFATRTLQAKAGDHVSVHDFNTSAGVPVLGDGSQADVSGINAAIAWLSAKGGGWVDFDGSKTYAVGRANPAVQRSGGIICAPKVNLNGNNAHIYLTNNANMIDCQSTVAASSVVTADVAAGATSVTVADGTKFATGNNVYYRLGESSYDTAESTYFGHAKVTGVVGNVVSLDVYLSRALTVAAVTNAANKTLYKLTLIESIKIENFYLDNSMVGADAERGVGLLYVRDIQVNNIESLNPGAGIFSTQFCEDCTANGLNILACAAPQISKGRAIGVAESKNIVVNDLRAANIDGTFIISEFGGDLTVNNATLDQHQTAGNPIINSVIQGSRLVLNNLRIHGKGGFDLVNTGGGSGNFYQINNLTLDVDTAPYGMPTFGDQLRGTLDMTIAGTREQYDIDAGKWHEITIPLINSMSSTTYRFEAGLYGPIYVYTSSNLSSPISTDLTSLLIGRVSDGGSSHVADLVAGKLVRLAGGKAFIGSVAGTFFSSRAEQMTVFVSTNSSGLSGSDKFLRVRAFIVPNTLALPLTQTISETLYVNGSITVVTTGSVFTRIIDSGAAANVAFRTNGVRQFEVEDNAAANSYVAVQGASGKALLLARGTNAALQLSSTGTGSVTFSTNGTGADQVVITHTANAVRYINLTGAPAGGDPTISCPAGGNLGITAAIVGAATSGNALGGAATSASTVLIVPAGTTAISSLRVPHGAAPTSPVNGDMWTTTAGIFVRINGVTVGPLT